MKDTKSVLVRSQILISNDQCTGEKLARNHFLLSVGSDLVHIGSATTKSVFVSFGHCFLLHSLPGSLVLRIGFLN